MEIIEENAQFAVLHCHSIKRWKMRKICGKQRAKKQNGLFGLVESFKEMILLSAICFTMLS